MYAKHSTPATTSRFYMVYEWQLAATGNESAAKLLQYLITYEAYKNAMQQANGGNARFQYHTREDIRKAFFGTMSVPTIIKAEGILEQLGFITKHKNPNPKYGFDNTTYYEIHDSVIQNWADSWSKKNNKKPVDVVKEAGEVRVSLKNELKEAIQTSVVVGELDSTVVTSELDHETETNVVVETSHKEVYDDHKNLYEQYIRLNNNKKNSSSTVLELEKKLGSISMLLATLINVFNSFFIREMKWKFKPTVGHYSKLVHLLSEGFTVQEIKNVILYYPHFARFKKRPETFTPDYLFTETVFRSVHYEILQKNMQLIDEELLQEEAAKTGKKQPKKHGTEYHEFTSVRELDKLAKQGTNTYA